MSAARPKIADYPFTTLVPNLGVVSAGETTFTVADVPGLIPGAAEGKGLGLDFLRHIERCSVLLHVLDCATLDPGRDPLSDLDAHRGRAGALRRHLRRTVGKPRLVALNKVDVPEARELADLVRPDLEARGLRVFEISAVSHAGLRELTFALAAAVEADRAARPALDPPRIVLRPTRRRRRRIHRRSRPREPRRLHRAWREAGALGAADRLRATTRRSAISPTGCKRLGVEDELARQGAARAPP